MAAFKRIRRWIVWPLWQLFWKTLGLDSNARLKFFLFRSVLPQVGYEPHTIRNLSEKAWPTVAALTAAQDHSRGIETIDWQAANEADDGSELLRRYASSARRYRNSRQPVTTYVAASTESSCRS